MLAGPQWLALEVKHLDRARTFYEEHLDLEPQDSGTDGEVAYAVGDTDLVLRAPSAVPRGGLHTHYAMEIPAGEYADWWDRLAAVAERADGADFDLVEHSFGDAKSLYCYDFDGHCVELGQSDVDGPGIDGLFEVVLEVEDLEAAEGFYGDLGLEVTSRGDTRRRVRMTAGDFDLELWEPQLGLADARGGVHVDLGVATDDPTGLADRIGERALDVRDTDKGVRIRDPDGHYLTLVQAE